MKLKKHLLVFAATSALCFVVFCCIFTSVKRSRLSNTDSASPASSNTTESEPSMRLEDIKELSLSDGLAIAPMCCDDVQEYYRTILRSKSVRSIEEYLNEEDREKIDLFFEKISFPGDAAVFLPKKYNVCPELMNRLFGIQNNEMQMITLDNVIAALRDVQAEYYSAIDNPEQSFFLMDAVLEQKIFETYGINPDVSGGSGIGFSSYFMNDDYSKVLFISLGTVAVLDYNYEEGKVSVSAWWDNGTDHTPERLFPYADSSECVVFTID